MLVYVFETKEWERRYLTEVVKDIELKFSEDRLNKDTAHKYKDAEAVIVFVDSRVDREVIDRLPRLRLIITRSTGYDHIDVRYAMERGIVVCNVPDYASITVAEYTIADKRMPIIKDAIIDVISSKTSDFVRTPEGREALRLELIRRLNIIIGRRWCPKHILY
jgi:hypothetical protein